MKQFTSRELHLIHLSLITRIQRVESMIKIFEDENDIVYRDMYLSESAELNKIKDALYEYK